MAIERDASKYALAKQWLLGELQDGAPHTMGGTLARAEAAGHAENTIRRAANALRVRQYPACMGARPRAGLVLLWQLKVSA
jgi:hypothetical protein